MPTRLIGGWSVPSWGGWITLQPLNANGTLPGGSTSSGGSGYAAASPTVIDVQRWQYRLAFKEKPLAMSGLLGASTKRRSDVTYDFKLELLWDPGVMPELLLRPKMGFSMNLLLGNSLSGMTGAFGGGMAGAGNYYATGITPKQWYFPVANCETITPLVDAQNHKLIGQIVTGHSTGHGFILPDDAAKKGAYETYLNATQTRLVR